MHSVPELRQPAEERWADLHMYGCSAGGVVHSHHGCVFTEFIEHRTEKLLAELYHNVLQLTAEHFENLLCVLCHAIDPGYCFIRLFTQQLNLLHTGSHAVPPL